MWTSIQAPYRGCPGPTWWALALTSPAIMFLSNTFLSLHSNHASLKQLKLIPASGPLHFPLPPPTLSHCGCCLLAGTCSDRHPHPTSKPQYPPRWSLSLRSSYSTFLLFANAYYYLEVPPWKFAGLFLFYLPYPTSYPRWCMNSFPCQHEPCLHSL